MLTLSEPVPLLYVCNVKKNTCINEQTNKQDIKQNNKNKTTTIKTRENKRTKKDASEIFIQDSS